MMKQVQICKIKNTILLIHSNYSVYFIAIIKSFIRIPAAIAAFISNTFLSIYTGLIIYVQFLLSSINNDNIIE